MHVIFTANSILRETRRANRDLPQHARTDGGTSAALLAAMLLLVLLAHADDAYDNVFLLLAALDGRHVAPGRDGEVRRIDLCGAKGR